jgi:3',5'-cyclic AMP phosphodiesterase CpdA
VKSTEHLTNKQPEQIMPGYFHNNLSRRSFLHQSLVIGGALSLSRFQTRGAEADSSSLRLALLSDTHIAEDKLNEYRGFKPWDNLAQVVPQVVQAKPDTVIIDGDAARLSGLHGDYQRLKEALQPVADVTPVLIGLGNHDDRANFFKVFEAPPSQTAPVKGKHVTVIEHPQVRVLVLDSLLYVNKVAGLLGKNQRLWLQRYVQGADTRPIVLFVHHTLGDGDGDLLDVDRLFSIVSASSKVKAIFYGHSHQWNHTRRESVHLINLPAVGYNFNDAEPVGWVDAEFLAGGVKLQLHAFAGNTAKHGETVDIDWAD